MEAFTKFYRLYERVMSGSSLATQDVKELLDGFKQISFMEAGNQHRDCLLLLFSIFHQTSLRKQWPDGVDDILCNTLNFDFLCRFLDEVDLMISYTCCRALAVFFKHIVQQDYLDGMLEILLVQLFQESSISANGYIHRLDLLSDILSRRTPASDHGDNHNFELSVCAIIVSHWQNLLSVIFNEATALQRHAKYQNILYSLCCLWNAVFKSLFRISSNGDANGAQDIFKSFIVSNDLLLKQIELDRVPVLCRAKCLSILLHGVPYSSHYSTHRCCYTTTFMNTARNNLSMMMETLADSALMKQWVFRYLSITSEAENSNEISTQNNKLLSESRFEMKQTIVTNYSGFEGDLVSNGSDTPINVGHTVHDAADQRVKSGELKICSGFLYAAGSQRQSEKILRKLLLLALRSLAVMAHESNTEDDITSLRVMSGTLAKFIRDWCFGVDSFNSVIGLFSEQDDYLFEALLCSLDIYRRICSHGTHRTFPLSAEVEQMFEPHFLFLSLLEALDWDHMVLIDFITSPETCCLVYLMRYLQYLLNDWAHWKAVGNRFAVDFQSGKIRLDKPSANVSSNAKTSADSRKFSSVCDSFDTVIDATKLNVEDLNVKSFLGSANDEDTFGFCNDSSEQSYAQTKCFSNDCESSRFDGYVNQAAVTQNKQRLLVDYSDSSSNSSCVHEENSIESDCLEYATSSTSCDLKNCCEDTFGCQDVILDKAMAVLIRFRLTIERLETRQLFLYKVQPLVRLLDQCERYYEAT